MTHQDLRDLADHDRPLPIESLHLRDSANRGLLETLSRATSLAKLRDLDLRDSGLGSAEVAAIATAFPRLDVLGPG